jgi:hypothetical protein
VRRIAYPVRAEEDGRARDGSKVLAGIVDASGRRVLTILVHEAGVPEMVAEAMNRAGMQVAGR